MSAKVIEKLDEVDAQREKLIVRLPWYRRFIRRYMTGDAFKAYNISTLMTWPTAFTAGMGSAKLWASAVIKFPSGTAFLTKLWAGVTSLAVGAWNIVTHTA